MSNVKERIIGAVTIMSEEEAEKVWNLIQASFILSDVEEIEPDPEELEALRRYDIHFLLRVPEDVHPAILHLNIL